MLGSMSSGLVLINYNTADTIVGLSPLVKGTCWEARLQHWGGRNDSFSIFLTRQKLIEYLSSQVNDHS